MSTVSGNDDDHMSHRCQVLRVLTIYFHSHVSAHHECREIVMIATCSSTVLAPPRRVGRSVCCGNASNAGCGVAAKFGVSCCDKYDVHFWPSPKHVTGVPDPARIIVFALRMQGISAAGQLRLPLPPPTCTADTAHPAPGSCQIVCELRGRWRYTELHHSC